MSGIQSIREGLTGNVTRVIVVAIIVTFIGSVGWAGFFSQGTSNIIANVGSKQITNVDLGFEISSQQTLLNQRFPDQKFEDEFLVNFSTESLISKFSNLHYLEEEGIVLTDDFVMKQLANEDQFLENGVFSQLRFDSFARSNGFIPSDYLNRIRQDLLANIWRLTLINSSFITDTEVQESIRLAEQERDISFIKLPLSKFKNSLEYNENDLNDFYQDNIGLYSEPEKVKVDYLILSSKDLEDDIQISEADIQEEYSDYLVNFDDTIRKSVSHIMLNINDARDLTEASNNLETVKKRIQEGETFESLVLEISEDEGTINTNGDLGALRYTTQKYYRINGGSVQLEGVKSDINVPYRYKYLDFGEKDSENPLQWDEIEKADYSLWQSNFDFDQAIEKSKIRMQENDYLKLVDENAKWIKDVREKKIFNLNYQKFRSELEQNIKITDKFKKLDNFSLKYSFKSLPYESQMIENDSILGTKRERWHKSLNKDIYIGEALNVLSDLRFSYLEN